MTIKCVNTSKVLGRVPGTYKAHLNFSYDYRFTPTRKIGDMGYILISSICISVSLSKSLIKFLGPQFPPLQI